MKAHRVSSMTTEHFKSSQDGRLLFNILAYLAAVLESEQKDDIPTWSGFGPLWKTRRLRLRTPRYPNESGRRERARFVIRECEARWKYEPGKRKSERGKNYGLLPGKILQKPLEYNIGYELYPETLQSFEFPRNLDRAESQITTIHDWHVTTWHISISIPCIPRGMAYQVHLYKLIMSNS